ncbi:hypothetical protein CQW23_21326 [Capsicum baccatum]|uniref:Chromo domain-containing protein n=1 Tax=Capsicum baccatum TaxID=33114 RepID=A0A2G2VXT6_CAPBA|nr:hypothetical protein CQW23_21326 [Capsicum baccatum]
MKLGVYVVCDGVESILNARECSLRNEVEKKREYLVKYKGLAHVHNHWITDEQLRLEGQATLTRFKKNYKRKSWKTEWSLPQRLLDKRMLAATDHSNTDADCHYEWLVKWTDLDYSHATWELENASFLSSREADKLMTDYEIRHQKAKKALHSLTEDEKMNADFPELPTPLEGSAPQVNLNHLSYINTLRKYWQKGQSAVIIDDQEGILKVVLFLLSLPKDVGLPFLIMTTSAALPLWEAEFSRWADANIVVYKGNRDVLAIIRTLEFYNKQGALMFQVLLSRYEAIVEVKCDTKFNRCNILSLLDTKYDKVNNELLDTDSDIDLTEFKKRFKHFVAYECKSSASKVIEYWVPVKLSNEQIEQYCACLFSNSTWLCSSLKNDSPSCIYDILVSTRKVRQFDFCHLPCCDHPYLEDQSVKGIVTKDIPETQHLDAEIKLSGKLELLNKILQEIKQQRKKVLILFFRVFAFTSKFSSEVEFLDGSGVISIRNILNDLICQKFGGDSYMSISGNVLSQVKEATLNKLNNKETGKFALLMETSACSRSVIKLSGIDTIILFNSDWDPNNYLRSLQKITVNSKSEHIKVLRLYSYFTVEEKALVLAKQDMPIDNINSIKQAACQELLSWGASYLYNVQSSISKSSSEVDDLDFVFPELSRLMSTYCENSGYNGCSKIVKVQKNGAAYSSEISLLAYTDIFGFGCQPHFLGTPRPSAGNKHKSRRIDVVNDASMRRRNTQEDHCLPDASPNTSTLPQSPNPNPLQMEMERIQKEKEQTTNLLQDVKLLLKSQMEEELDSVRKKYDLLFQIAEKESAQKKKELDTIFINDIYNVCFSPDDVGRTTTETGQSSPNRPSSVPMETASISEPVNSEQRAADPQISSENFPMTVIPSLLAELPRVEESAVVPQTSGRATLQKSSSSNLPTIGSFVNPIPNYQSVILTPSNAELSRMKELAAVPWTSGKATLQTESSSNLPTSGSHATPTANYQSVILTPSQPSIQTLSNAARPGAGREQLRPAPHLRSFRPLPTMNLESQPVVAVTPHF